MEKNIRNNANQRANENTGAARGSAHSGAAGTGAPRQAQKRAVPQTQLTGLKDIRNLILLGVLLAAGVVLKMVLASSFPVMKPNFVIAMYCLSVLLIRPTLVEGAVIGVLAGVLCQFFPGVPYINLVSELVGGVVMTLLLRVPLRADAFDLHPIVGTFLSTLASGFTYVGVMYLSFYAGAAITPTPLGAFLAIIFGTAAINAIIVQVLEIPLRAALKGNNRS
ncbi:MAG: hypothetical protein LBS72_00125 [Oscillospiraceae bacterium]|jgi:hypothetical protein|nr:hypothetical protein [Oscillospiraceae bacterium]